MATIKSYSDLQQSKKLAEILQLESADMCWQYQKDRWVGEPDYKEFPQFEHATDKRDILCWSLAALLGVLPYPYIEQNYKGKWICRVEHENTTYLWEDSNPIDACVAMIEKLNKLEVL